MSKTLGVSFVALATGITVVEGVKPLADLNVTGKVASHGKSFGVFCLLFPLVS